MQALVSMCQFYLQAELSEPWLSYAVSHKEEKAAPYNIAFIFFFAYSGLSLIFVWVLVFG